MEELRKTIQKLIARYEAVKAENKALKASLAESRLANDSCRKQITELEEQISNLKLTAAFTAGNESPAGARERIDKMIREIDKCISIIETDKG